MKVFLAHHGQPWLPPEQQRPFTIPGWGVKIPIGGRIEVTAKMLRRLSRSVEETPEDFAQTLMGIYNREGSPAMLEMQVEEDAAQPPNQNLNPNHDYAGAPGEQGPVGESGVPDEPGHEGAPGPEVLDTAVSDIEAAGYRGATATDILRHAASTTEEEEQA